jgi:hypothetical protein
VRQAQLFPERCELRDCDRHFPTKFAILRGETLDHGRRDRVVLDDLHLVAVCVELVEDQRRDVPAGPAERGYGGSMTRCCDRSAHFYFVVHMNPVDQFGAAHPLARDG